MQRLHSEMQDLPNRALYPGGPTVKLIGLQQHQAYPSAITRRPGPPLRPLHSNCRPIPLTG